MTTLTVLDNALINAASITYAFMADAGATLSIDTELSSEGWAVRKEQLIQAGNIQATEDLCTVLVVRHVSPGDSVSLTVNSTGDGPIEALML
jgi:hypothetical protein